ncbi:hypothetical protein N7463_009088 [Penicillium fimorum]|uniref:Uncharacterized protein n=1 Tax=Penicillium fimorum TaxID=1882269 RepID=A0A9W9XQ61_9EURO|nr:hypothetical protein N7463_009088 [Penicillium fimorum]
MRFSSALLVVFSASFVAAVPISSPNEAAAALNFEMAYEEKRSPKKDEAAGYWFSKGYTEKRSPNQDDTAGYWFSKGYEKERSPKGDGAAASGDKVAYGEPK